MRVSWRLVAAVRSRQRRNWEVDAIATPGPCGESADGDAFARTEKCRRDVPLAAVNRVLFGVMRRRGVSGRLSAHESPDRSRERVAEGRRRDTRALDESTAPHADRWVSDLATKQRGPRWETAAETSRVGLIELDRRVAMETLQ